MISVARVSPDIAPTLRLHQQDLEVWQLQS
jgi:hypothetical protein